MIPFLPPPSPQHKHTPHLFAAHTRLCALAGQVSPFVSMHQSHLDLNADTQMS